MTRLDAIVIGAGQAGPSLAGRLAGAGMKVAIVERGLVGGTCVNTGCMPTKTLVASAYAAHLARRDAEYGVVRNGGIGIDWIRVRDRARKVATDARTGLEEWLGSIENCRLVRGHARFEGPGVVRVGDETLSAPKIFLNVGARAIVPDLPGVGTVPHLTNSSILALDAVPDHLVIVGGSYVGLEFAQAFRRFGARVTVIERASRLVSREDEDVSAAIRGILEAEGIEIRTDAECIRLEPHPRGVAVSGSIGSHVLLAVGRRPNTDDLGLDRAGIVTDARGFVTVDDELRTTAEGVWALGECNGHGAFTHTAYNDFEIVAANLLDGGRRRLSDRVLGYALYVDPPLGRAGMTEREARETGKPILVSARPMTRVGRAIEKGETLGFMKVVADAETRKIVGASILGVGGDEAIHGVLDVMNAGVAYDVLRWSVPIHPTVSELWPTVLGDLRPAE